jgi:AcrR family transcriptional regulator
MPPRTTSARAATRGRGRPPGATADATRARILEAARACFARTGYGATTNRDIAQQAGLTPAALYQYFDSKLSLFMATVRDAQSELAPRFREAIAGAPTLRAALRSLVDASVAIDEGDASITAFLSALPVEIRRHAEIAEAVAAEPNPVVEVFLDVVARGAERGELAPGITSDQVFSMFVACNMGLSLYAAAIDPRQLAATAGAFGALLDGQLFVDSATAAPPGSARGAPRPRPKTPKRKA